MVYNKALEYRHKAYYRRGESIDYNQASAMLTRWKQTERYAFLNEVSSVPLQQALRHLQQGFSTFFEQQTGYPRFKKKRVVTGSAEYTRSAFTWAAGRLTLAKQSEPLKVRWSRRLPHGAVPSTLTVSRDAAGRVFECAMCGHTEDRDVNAAKNILAAGPAVTACRDGMGHEPS